MSEKPTRTDAENAVRCLTRIVSSLATSSEPLSSRLAGVWPWVLALEDGVEGMEPEADESVRSTVSELIAAVRTGPGGADAGLALLSEPDLDRLIDNLVWAIAEAGAATARVTDTP